MVRSCLVAPEPGPAEAPVAAATAKPAVADASGRSGRNAAGGAKLAASLSSDALVEKPDAQPGGIHGAAPSPAWYGRDAA